MSQVSQKPASGRRLDSWIESFIEFTETLPSPPIFRRWAAISAIAGVLERKVWLNPFGPNLYPNLYIVLCGPPSIGKTVVTSQVGLLWNEISDLHVAPSSVTAAALVDSLEDAKRQVIPPGEPFVEFNSIQVNSNELGVLIPGYESELMNTLTDIYDGHQYSQRRRGGNKKVLIKNPQINILAATTPAYLTSTMPPSAWDQGFMSRLIVIYSGEATIRPLFSWSETDRALNKNLLDDLKSIHKLYGKMHFTDAAADRIKAWHMAGGPPRPEHPRLQNYVGRRTTHLLKLCMIASASQREDRMIDVAEYELALDWLIEAEMYMPDIFKAMATGGDATAISDAYFFVYSHFAKKKEMIQQHRLIAFLQERIPAHSVMRVIDLMVNGKLLRQQMNNAGETCYLPVPKEDRQ